MAEVSFRFTAKNAFLTYPHAEFNFDELYEFLSGKFSLTYAVISKEAHQDGTPHVHAALKFDHKINLKSAQSFDFQGKHPNIQSIRNWNATATYVKKDGDFKEFGSKIILIMPITNTTSRTISIRNI